MGQADVNEQRMQLLAGWQPHGLPSRGRAAGLQRRPAIGQRAHGVTRLMAKAAESFVKAALNRFLPALLCAAGAGGRGGGAARLAAL